MNAGKYPFFGSVATKVTGARRPGMPPSVAVPYAMSIGLRPGYFGGNYLGVQHDPFQTGSDPNSPRYQVRNLTLPKNLTIDRLEDRPWAIDGLLRPTHFSELDGCNMRGSRRTSHRSAE